MSLARSLNSSLIRRPGFWLRNCLETIGLQPTNRKTSQVSERSLPPALSLEAVKQSGRIVAQIDHGPPLETVEALEQRRYFRSSLTCVPQNLFGHPSRERCDLGGADSLMPD